MTQGSHRGYWFKLAKRYGGLTGFFFFFFAMTHKYFTRGQYITLFWEIGSVIMKERQSERYDPLVNCKSAGSSAGHCWLVKCQPPPGVNNSDNNPVCEHLCLRLCAWLCMWAFSSSLGVCNHANIPCFRLVRWARSYRWNLANIFLTDWIKTL